MAKLGAKPFFFKGGSEGVLLIHGYTGAPGEMRLLGEFCTAGVILCLEFCCPGTVNRHPFWQKRLLPTGMTKLSAGLCV